MEKLDSGYRKKETKTNNKNFWVVLASEESIVKTPHKTSKHYIFIGWKKQNQRALLFLPWVVIIISGELSWPKTVLPQLQISFLPFIHEQDTKILVGVKEMGYAIAVIGATGNVGRETLQLLEARRFPVSRVYAVASDRSVGQKISFGDSDVLTVEGIGNFDFSGVDLAIFCTEGKISAQYVPKAMEAGCRVIDKSSTFRMNPNVPLVVPEVNGDLLINTECRLVANPNCVTIPLALALQPLHRQFGVKRAVVATYQSVSGAGKDAMDELYNQTRAIFVNQAVEVQHLPRQIAFNVIPRIDSFESNGFTGEEVKIREEIGKIIGPEIGVAATCVRVPVFIGHSAAVSLELERNITAAEARKIWANSDGLLVVDRLHEEAYVTPLDVVGEDVAVISRIRIDPSVDNGLMFWISCDNLRKGAALNGVQIAEKWLLQGTL